MIKKKKRKKAEGMLLICFLAILFAIPVFLTIAASFLIEDGIGLGGYRTLLFDCFPFYTMFWNTVLYAAVGTILQLIVAVLCAYGMTVTGNPLLLLGYILFMMMPLQVTLLPNYIGLRDLGLLGTRLSILLPIIFSPFGVVVIHQYMKQIDMEIVDAMRLETGSTVRLLRHAVLPQIGTCILAVAVFVFADNWNLLEQPMLFLKDSSLQPLSVMIAEADRYSGEVLYPAAVLFLLPVFFLFQLLRDNLEKEGLRIL